MSHGKKPKKEAKPPQPPPAPPVTERDEDEDLEDGEEEETPAVDVKPTSKVSVEMTKAEMDEFASYKAAKATSDEKNPAPEMLEITLRFGHHRNGVAFNPGVHKVPRAEATELLAADQRALEARMAVHQSNNYLVEIAQGGPAKVRKVAEIGL